MTAPVAAYESRPNPASAVALEDGTTLILVKRAAFIALLEMCPTLVRGLPNGLWCRLLELTPRIAEVTGSPFETRFAHVCLTLS
jgi:CRP-like cAMP-binding protein